MELLVPLTWPIEKDDTQMTVNHHRHIPYIQIAQASYKRAILENQSKCTLRTAVRIGLPPMAIPLAERTSRDEGIIRLLLYFFRNIALISTSQNIPTESKEDAISRSATIEAFHYQDVFALILTISSNIGEDFNTQDVVMLEILFHILKGIDVEKLFMDKDKLDKSNADELGSLLAKEKNMHRGYAKSAPTRHNRFGTMIWVKRDNARMSTVSGQENLTSTQLTLSKMDRSKRWNKPKRGKDVVYSNGRFDLPTPVTYQASQHLRSFVEEFLDSSFNPLFSHIRRAIEREADRVLEAHKQQFFYLISWFLQAERARRHREGASEMRNKHNNLVKTFEANNFALVASVLNQETFVTLHRFMQDRLDLKFWRELTASMRCFTQILLIVQDMAKSPLEEDQEIAENIQNRIFYEETTHDRVIAVLRGYKDQGFDYLDACTELSHVFLRMLERYSKENIDLQVRSRRRARKQKNKTALDRGDADAYGDDASEREDVAEAQRESKERKFDFTRLSTRFMTQSCINTFVAFTKYYNDLDAEQLKRAHRFFHRVAFKQDLSVMLFRVDIVAMFYEIIQGSEALDRASPAFREWEDLVRHLIRKLTHKLQDRPELAIEMLFSKIPSSVFYLEFGYEKQSVSSKPRPPATLEVKGAMSKDEQIGVAVAVLHEEKFDAINWVMNILSSAMSERQSWEGEAAARRIDQAQGEASGQSGIEAKAPSIGKLTMLPL